ncbi:MAG: 5-formyltetrahydrofolate cyclo-ligase [Candidatus Uhrbacteria bacterium]|nr:5-formyltetrahydrofolate cyclo-ligase [Candidatus Uhrbacteria bacterium]
MDLLFPYDASVIYLPMRGEMDYRHPAFPLTVFPNSLMLPADQRADPFVWAETVKTRLANKHPYILIPGRAFDLSGTRHGKGGGWYDRFLSKVPWSWLRIGIASQSQISSSSLLKQVWDEPMDWILSSDGLSWDAHETQARIHPPKS